MAKISLLEAYKNKIAVAEQYSVENGNGKLSDAKKLTVARCLANTQKHLQEAFENSVGVQRSDL